MGMTVTAAAKTAKVSRETVHRWKSTDKNFISAFRGGKRELQEVVNIELYRLAHQAELVLKNRFMNKYLSDDLAYKFLIDVGIINGSLPEMEEDDPAETKNETDNEEGGSRIPAPSSEE